MAMYMCVYCDKMLDDDWFPCEDAELYFNLKWANELLCPDCVAEIEEELDGAGND